MRDEDLKIEIHRLEANVAQLGELVTQNFISLLEIKEQIISVRDHLERLEKEEKLYRKNFNHLIILNIRCVIKTITMFSENYFSIYYLKRKPPEHLTLQEGRKRLSK